MFSGLRGEDINRKYLDLLRQRVLEPIVIELRTELGLPGIDQAPISTAEIELVWMHQCAGLLFRTASMDIFCACSRTHQRHD